MKVCEGPLKAVQNSDLNASTSSFPGKELLCKLMIHIHQPSMRPVVGQQSSHDVLPNV